MRRNITLILGVFFTLSLNIKGQDVSVTTAFDTSKILIGDQINFTIVVDQPVDLNLTLPIFRDSITRNIEILSGPDIDSINISDDRVRITEKYLVTSFDSGFYRIDPVYAEKSDSSGIKRYFSDYSMLEVARGNIAPPDSTSEIFDIVAPYKAPVTLGEILPWILLVLIASAFIWFLLKLFRKFKKQEKVVNIPVRTEPAHVIAFRELEKLRNEKLWQTGETKQYYTRLTEIIRQYLENRFLIYSLEMTTSETLEALLKTGFKKDDSYYLLRSVLTGADLVKFAKYKPEPDENELCFTNSWDFVTKTKEEVAVEGIDGNKKEEGRKKE
jgi:hypothetical protein